MESETWLAKLVKSALSIDTSRFSISSFWKTTAMNDSSFAVQIEGGIILNDSEIEQSLILIRRLESWWAKNAKES